ncbi:cell division ATP-binding protein FtsE [Lachnospiraceae bacterium JC7]|nr:cell division ATP-binding protein FtsE [Lachnospiraceae bacterium JC7]
MRRAYTYISLERKNPQMIELTDVSKTYRTGVNALRNINLTIRDGEFCFIVGKSGSGKSTLVRLLTKELDTDSGSILVNDTDLGKLRRSQVPAYRRRLGVVFQDFRLLEDRTVYENIAFAQLIIGKSDAEIFENVTKILSLTGLSSKADSYPRQLSGGEQQRTAIARALVNRPEILIADEPTGNLDHENAEEIMKLLERINDQGTTVIVITHDREMVSRMNRRTVSMSMGEIIADTSEDLLYDEEKNDWTDDWEEDWDEDKDTEEEVDWLDDDFEDDTDSISIESSADAPTYSKKKTARGLKGAHRPHHKSGKEDTR